MSRIFAESSFDLMASRAGQDQTPTDRGEILSKD
jgi:hypothetical protein